MRPIHSYLPNYCLSRECLKSVLISGVTLIQQRMSVCMRLESLFGVHSHVSSRLRRCMSSHVLRKTNMPTVPRYSLLLKNKSVVQCFFSCSVKLFTVYALHWLPLLFLLRKRCRLLVSEGEWKEVSEWKTPNPFPRYYQSQGFLTMEEFLKGFRVSQ